jgi:hypothetical protein
MAANLIRNTPDIDDAIADAERNARTANGKEAAA